MPRVTCSSSTTIPAFGSACGQPWSGRVGAWLKLSTVKKRSSKSCTGPPRAILLDLNMPVMDGFAFLHSLREKPGCADIPVIVFSARDISASDRRRLHDADRIMSKTTRLEGCNGGT